MSLQSNQGGQGARALKTLARMGLVAPRLGTADFWWLESPAFLPEAAKRKPREPEPEEEKEEKGKDKDDDAEDEYEVGGEEE